MNRNFRLDPTIQRSMVGPPQSFLVVDPVLGPVQLGDSHGDDVGPHRRPLDQDVSSPSCRTRPTSWRRNTRGSGLV